MPSSRQTSAVLFDCLTSGPLRRLVAGLHCLFSPGPLGQIQCLERGSLPFGYYEVIPSVFFILNSQCFLKFQWRGGKRRLRRGGGLDTLVRGVPGGSVKGRRWYFKNLKKLYCGTINHNWSLVRSKATDTFALIPLPHRFLQMLTLWYFLVLKGGRCEVAMLKGG